MIIYRVMRESQSQTLDIQTQSWQWNIHGILFNILHPPQRQSYLLWTLTFLTKVPEFTILANQHNIHLHTFPSHLTHILQPLDVTVFAQYKHWHRRAIQQAIRNFDIDYNVISFFRDLSEIRTQTFTKGNCMKAFRDSGIWPANYEKIEKKVAMYAKPELLETPKQANQASQDLSNWSQRFES